MTNSLVNAIINLSIGEADFLFRENAPLVSVGEQTVFPIDRRKRGFLLEGKMPLGIYDRSKAKPNRGMFQKGHIPTQETIDKTRKANTGQKRSEEVKQKLRENSARYWQGKTLSLEHRKKIKENHANMKGERNPSWKDGRINSQGYIRIHKPEHPFCNKQGYIYEHRFVVEAQIGRYLTSKEHVHHLGEKDDNRPSMLMGFKNNGYHQWFHRKGSCNPKGIIFDGRELQR